ncbi:MAG: AAA family ATPase, partial [Spirochaetales bacterium]|nr:AAA family ATPase [Spirochaetales bacterium]
MTAILDTAKVAVENLRWKLAPEGLGFKTTDDLEPQIDIIGQERGVEAFKFGMGMEAKGYNIFVVGPSNIGKLAVVKRLLENVTREQKTPDDICYVNSFKTPEEPVLLRFVAGNGVKFKAAVDKFLENIKREVPQLFESQEYIHSKNALIEEHDKKTREFFKGLEERVKDAGFVMVNMQMGQVQRPDIVPVIDGEPVHLLKVEEMTEKGRFPKEEFTQLQEKYKELKDEIDAIFLEVRTLQKEVKRKSEEVDRLMFMNIAKELAEPLIEGWRDSEKVAAHVDALLEDMAENLDAIKAIGQPQQGPMGMTFPGASAEAVLHPYGVNLLVDNSEVEGPPVIFESHPTYRNLFGS